MKEEKDGTEDKGRNRGLNPEEKELSATHEHTQIHTRPNKHMRNIQERNKSTRAESGHVAHTYTSSSLSRLHMFTKRSIKCITRQSHSRKKSTRSCNWATLPQAEHHQVHNPQQSHSRKKSTRSCNWATLPQAEHHQVHNPRQSHSQKVDKIMQLGHIPTSRASSRTQPEVASHRSHKITYLAHIGTRYGSIICPRACVIYAMSTRSRTWRTVWQPTGRFRCAPLRIPASHSTIASRFYSNTIC
jgi:hypothetical protein